MKKSTLTEIQKRAFAEEIAASYAQQCDDVIIGIGTHVPEYFGIFMMILFGKEKNKVAELSFGVNTAKLLVEKLNKFIDEEEGGKNV